MPRKKTKTTEPARSFASPLEPSSALLTKLGSALVHAEEMLSPGGHPFDRAALEALLQDGEVRLWLGQMESLSLLPVKR